jgi:hypothetical protein
MHYQGAAAVVAAIPNLSAAAAVVAVADLQVVRAAAPSWAAVGVALGAVVSILAAVAVPSPQDSPSDPASLPPGFRQKPLIVTSV